MADTQNRGNLLIVDDDKFIVRLFSNMFEKLYDIRTASNGVEALNVLKSGYVPGVILSDNLMPEMNGDDFLAESIKITPDSIRIIITAKTEPKEIINAINKSKAFMYLTKPIEQIELVQAIRVGFHHYNNKKELKRVNTEFYNHIKQLDVENAKLKKLSESGINFKKGITKFILNQITSAEYLYFTPHTKYVVDIVQSISKDLKLAIFNKANLVYAATLHNLPILNLPENLKFKCVSESNSNELNTFLVKNYSDTFDYINSIPDFEDVYKICVNYWDYMEFKTKAPNNNIEDIKQETQMLALAYLYHNHVYGINEEQYNTLLEKGRLEQTPEETTARHEAFLKKLADNPYEIDKEIIKSFTDSIRFETAKSLMPSENLLKIILDPIARIKEFEEDFGKEEIVVKMPSVLKVKVSELEPGMILGQDLHTIRGSVLGHKGSKLDIKILNKVRQLESTGLVDGNENVVILRKPVEV